MSLPRYPEYKDSGVAWLGEVPGHWDVIRLKNVLYQRITDGPHTTPTFLNDGVPFLSVDGIQDGELEFEGCRFISESDHEEYRTKALPRKDDLLMGKAASTGKIARVKVDFEFSIWSPLALIRLDPKVSNPAFYEQSLKSPIVQAQIDNLCTANTQKNISMDDIPKLILTRLPLAEQNQIVAFLDRETGKIDALIAEQRRLVGLLAEKRQAVISHAVTKGLGTRHSRAGGNPAENTIPRSGQNDCPAAQEYSNQLDSRLRGNDGGVPMKNSGIEWLGEVPEHWKVIPLKRDLLFLTSGSRGWADHYADDGALFIRIGNLPRNDIHLDLSDIQRVDVPVGTEGERTKVQAGDVLFSITAYLGSVAVVPDDLEVAYVSQHVALARLAGTLLLPKWIAYITLSSVGKTYLETQGYGGTKVQLSLDDVKNIPMIVPTLDEQRNIVLFLETETAKFDTLTAEANRAIALLQERRSALISAAVTGKIDVRSLSPSPSPILGEGSV